MKIEDRIYLVRGEKIKQMKLSPTEIYKDKNIFFIGGTGFVGKVTLSMLLNNFPDVGKVYMIVRARNEEESLSRFWNSVVTSPTFDPLREKYGDGFEAFLRDKVVPLNGDVSADFLGMSEKQAKKIMSVCDVIINSAGNVTFNPPLESAGSAGKKVPLPTFRGTHCSAKVGNELFSIEWVVTSVGGRCIGQRCPIVVDATGNYQSVRVTGVTRK